MPRYDDYDRDDDDDYDDIRVGGRRHRDAPPGEKPQSGLGVGSIFLGIIVFVGYFVVIGAAVVIAGGNNNAPMRDDDPVAVALGLGIIGTFCLNLIGLVLGIVACFQSDRNMLCGILGTVFNAILFFGVITLVCAGLLMG
jgi:hypothetical protein